MQALDQNYTHSEIEFDKMRELMVRSYLVDRKPFNWRLAMAENWYYASRYLEQIEYFNERVHLWRDESGNLLAFLIRDSVLPIPRWITSSRDLEDEMFAWAEAHWGGEKSEIRTMVYDWDVQRQQLLKKRGYENKGAIEDVRIYDLSREHSGAEPGTRIQVRLNGGRGTMEAAVWLLRIGCGVLH